MEIEIENPTEIEIDNDAEIIRGPRGYSNYELAVKNGFVGTEQEYLESLKGLQGEKGGCNFATFEVENGSLIMNKDDDMENINFSLKNGNLEVEING